MPFDGLPAGKLRLTLVPDLFFTELLPQIDDLGELKVTLYVLHRIQRSAEPRLVRRSDMLADAQLAQGLAGRGQSVAEALDQALERAVRRGALLRLDVAGDAGADQWFVINSPNGRKLAADMQSGLVQLPEARRVERFIAGEERPSIYTLYEQNIGLLQPMIAEQLRDAAESYPDEWISEAFQLAVENNVRKWSYIRAILKRWEVEGKSDEADRRDTETDEFAEIRRRYGGLVRQ
jgi:DNA replication protein